MIIQTCSRSSNIIFPSPRTSSFLEIPRMMTTAASASPPPLHPPPPPPHPPRNVDPMNPTAAPPPTAPLSKWFAGPGAGLLAPRTSRSRQLL
uniref:Uncharacterized protein n=1 Tax=Rhizophora mucronata TaxID=61149 RepID=A0A2P2Q272_RHIMU